MRNAKDAGLSIEEAERAASAYVPLWTTLAAAATQAKEPPGAGGTAAKTDHVTDDDLRSLGGPLTGSPSLQMSPPPVIVAPAPPPDVDERTEVNVVPPPEPKSKRTATVIGLAPASSNDPTAADFATQATSPAATPVVLHQPIPAAPPLEILPSIIVADEIVQENPKKPAAVAATSAPALREPKTDPPASRAKPAQRPTADADADWSPGSRVPRSRAPLMLWGGLGTLVVAAGLYFATRGGGEPYVAPSGSSVSAVRAASAAASAVSVGPNIPPPAPPSETPTPPAAVSNPTPPAAANAATVAAASAPLAAPLPPPVVAAAPPPPPVAPASPVPRAAARPSPPEPPAAAVYKPPTPRPAHPAAPKNPPTSPAAGGIVRDNPF